jgi:hypothetical protein
MGMGRVGRTQGGGSQSKKMSDRLRELMLYNAGVARRERQQAERQRLNPGAAGKLTTNVVPNGRGVDTGRGPAAGTSPLVPPLGGFTGTPSITTSGNAGISSGIGGASTGTPGAGGSTPTPGAGAPTTSAGTNMGGGAQGATSTSSQLGERINEATYDDIWNDPTRLAYAYSQMRGYDPRGGALQSLDEMSQYAPLLWNLMANQDTLGGVPHFIDWFQQRADNYMTPGANRTIGGYDVMNAIMDATRDPDSPLGNSLIPEGRSDQVGTLMATVKDALGGAHIPDMIAAGVLRMMDQEARAYLDDESRNKNMDQTYANRMDKRGINESLFRR